MHRAMVPPTLIARSARFAAVCLIVVFAETAHAQVPNIKIQETCRAAAGVMVSLMGNSTSQNDVEICVESENKARQQLIKDWSTYQASDRAGCIQPNVYLPSYIEWLTCFEMNKSVREGRREGGVTSELINPDGSVTMPPVGSLGIMSTTRRSYAQSKNAPKRDQGTVRSAAIKAAETAWNKLPPNEFACADQNLTARGDSIQSLARRGVLPSDATVAEIRAQCLSSSSPTPSPIVAQAAQQSPQQQPSSPPQQRPSSPPQQQPSSDEQARQQEALTNLNQPVESLKTDLATSTARVAELEKGKAAAESALKQAEQARSDAQKAQHETDQARNADKAKLDAVTAQFEAYKASADANTDWRWAYAGMGGLIGLIAGLTTFLFTKWRRFGLRLHTQ